MKTYEVKLTITVAAHDSRSALSLQSDLHWFLKRVSDGATMRVTYSRVDEMRELGLMKVEAKP